MDALTTIEVQEGYKQILDIVEHRDPTLCQASTDFEHVYQQACEAQEILKKAFASEWQLDDSKGCPLHPEVILPLLCRCVCVSPARRSTRGTHDTPPLPAPAPADEGAVCTPPKEGHYGGMGRRGGRSWRQGQGPRKGEGRQRLQRQRSHAQGPPPPPSPAFTCSYILCAISSDPPLGPEHRTWRA